MVADLQPPVRPLPEPATVTIPQGVVWRRIWHLDDHTPEPSTLRMYGPLHRFDPHVDAHPGSAQECPEGRGVVYLATDWQNAAAEVFGRYQLTHGQVGEVCPAWRLTELVADGDLRLVDIRTDGAMRIGALPMLGAGAVPRPLSQEWARAMYEDYPTHHGVLYQAAHISGDCIALWDRAPTLRIADTTNADVALQSPPVWQRMTVFLVSIGAGARQIRHENCARCNPDAEPLALI